MPEQLLWSSSFVFFRKLQHGLTRGADDVSRTKHRPPNLPFYLPRGTFEPPHEAHVPSLMQETRRLGGVLTGGVLTKSAAENGLKITALLKLGSRDAQGTR